MRIKKKELRVRAAYAFEWAHHDRAGAKKRLKQTWKGTQPAKPGEYCETWNHNLATNLDVEDAPRSGRPTTVSNERIKAVLLRFLEGWGNKKQWKGWKSFGVALRHDRDLNKLVRKLHLTTKQVFTRMKMVGCCAVPKPGCAVGPCVYVGEAWSSVSPYFLLTHSLAPH